MNFTAFTDEFCKLSARPVTREEAEKSLGKLRSMEEDRDLGSLGRSAGVGAALMPAAGLATRMVSGTQRFLKPGSKVTGRNPLALAKAVDWGGLGRQAAADSMFGAIGGGVTPMAREAVEQKAQKAKLEDYIEQQRGTRRRGAGKFRHQVQQHIGV